MSLRPVIVSKGGKKVKGYFHRFVYQFNHNYSETKALVELYDGSLRFYDPFFVKFSDRSKQEDEDNE
ncbi:hypothetical protein [Reichenbachiella versicolor]|uniref:hypothetical protein n=1 Tax=Reichenbachiella versicolor TaxID=1821036 RepID=UPI000D6E32F9|nr:hypothetical protein [Reichenbachiella versicolor]